MADEKIDLSKVTVGGEPLIQEEPPNEEPTGEEVPVEEPVQEEPVQEEPTEEPVQEEPASEEPPVEEPAPELTKEPVVQESQDVAEFKQLLEGDEYFRNMYQYYKQNKDMRPFLEAYMHDFEKMSDEDIIRLSFDREYQDLDQRQRDILFRREVLGKYASNEDDFDDDGLYEEDRDFKSALLKRDANKLRKELIDNQKQYQQELGAQSAQGPSEEELLKQREENVKASQEALKGVLPSGVLKLNVGDAEINYNVKDVNKIVENAVDLSGLIDSFSSNGEINWGLFAKVNALIQDPSGYDSTLYNQGKSDGKAEFEEGLKNQQIPGNGKPADDLNKPTGHPLENKEAFLKEALKNK